MKRRELPSDNEEMTDRKYIEHCHELIDYLETRLDNLIYERGRLLRMLTKEQLEEHMEEVMKDGN